MNDQIDHLDPADEGILTYTVSDEALEAAAGTERGIIRFYSPVPSRAVPAFNCC